MYYILDYSAVTWWYRHDLLSELPDTVMAEIIKKKKNYIQSFK